jgi:pentatricopeptide repeat protein
MRSLSTFWKRLVMVIICSLDCLVIKFSNSSKKRKKKKPEEGIRLFRLMRALYFVPDSFICEVLMRCLCENLLLDDAMNTFKEMIDNEHFLLKAFY